MADVVMCWCEKGGSGKSSAAVGIADEAARTGRRVIVIDLDPQATISTWLLGKLSGPSSLDVLKGTVAVDVAARPAAEIPGVLVVRGDELLARADAELAADPLPQLSLRRALDRLPADTLVIVDAAAAYGVLSIIGLVAADRLVMPLRPSMLDLGSAQSTFKRVDAVRASINATLTVAAIVLTAFDARTSIGAVLEQHLADEHPGVPVIRIPAAVAVSMAPAALQPVSAYAPGSPAATAYRQLAGALNLGGST